jgi:hypothetical protein
MTTAKRVSNLSWLIQGHTFHTDTIVLDLLPYDAILGYDLLQTNSPMSYDWQAKKLQFTHSGKSVTLYGLQDPPSTPATILAKQVYKSSQRNDIWAYVIVDPLTPSDSPQPTKHTQHEDLQHLLAQYADVFQEPKQLPP